MEDTINRGSKSIVSLNHSDLTCFKSNLRISRLKQMAELKQLLLRKKNMLIARRALVTKLHYELQARIRGKQKRNQLDSARNKRQHVLENIKQKAVSSSDRLLSIDSKSMAFSLLFTLSLSKKIETSKSPLKLIGDRNMFNFSIEILEKSNFFVDWKKYSLLKLKIKLSSRSVLVDSFKIFFQNIGLNDYDNSNYRSLLYAYIMNQEFHESVKLGIHPGFNANYGDKISIFFHNCIWLLLYKISNNLLDSIEDIISNKNHSTAIYETVQSCWKNYQFYFQLFKSLHYQNLKKILEQAVRVVNFQFSVSPCRELIGIRDRLIQTEVVLNNSNLSFEMNDNYKKLIEEIKKHVEFVDKSSIYLLNYQQIDSNIFIYKNFEYRTPCRSIISQGQWRKYWFHHYRWDRRRTIKLRSGKMSIRKLRSIDEIPLTIGKIGEVLQVNFFNIDENFLSSPTKHWFEQIRFLFTDIPLKNPDDGNERAFLKHKDQLKLAKTVKSWLRNYFEVLPPIEAIVDKTAMIEILRKPKITASDRHILIQKIQEFKIHIANYWIKQCQFKDFKNYQIYENLLVLLRNEYFLRLRVEFHTKSPQLIFPKFYKMLHPFIKTSETNTMKIITNCLTDPKIGEGDEYQPQAAKFFSEVYNTIIIYNNCQLYKSNEIHRTFYRELYDLHCRINQVINQNVWLLLFKQYCIQYLNNQSSIRISLQGQTFEEFIEIISEKIDKDKVNQFTKYYTLSQYGIHSVLQSKLLLILNNQELEHVGKTFHFFPNKILKLIEEVHELTYYIYCVYSPIFNWIYADLGI